MNTLLALTLRLEHPGAVPDKKLSFTNHLELLDIR